MNNENKQNKLQIRNIMSPKHLYFFYGKDKANERAGHLMVSDHRRPRPRAL